MTAAQKSAAQSRKPRSAEPTRRTPEYKRPYLQRSEIELILEALDADPSELNDPSLASAVAELRRWV